MSKLLIFIMLLVPLSFSAWGQDLSRPRPKTRPRQKTPQKLTQPTAQKKGKWLVNFGSHTEFYNSVQADDSGGQRQFDFAPTLGFGMMNHLSGDFSFLPEFNWVLPRKSGSSEIIKNLFMLRADFGYEALSWLRLRAGTSLMWLNQHGKGGSAQVNNGNGTSTFYYPSENRSSLNNTLDFGAEGLFNEDFSVRLQTYIYSVFKEERRQISYTLFVSYYWDR